MRTSQAESGEVSEEFQKDEKPLSTSERISSAFSFNISEQGDTRDTGFCHQGLLTAGGKRLQLFKMFSLTVVPIMVLWSLTIYTVTESTEERATAEDDMKQLLYATEIGKFIHQLQRERDMSVLYLSALGPETRTFLTNEYLDTDDSVASLSTWPNDITRAGWQDPVFGTRGSLLEYLGKHRISLDKSTFDIYLELNFYNYIIDSMLFWLTTRVSNGRYSTVWRTLIAFTKITIGKQDVGVERSLGTYFFVKGGFHDREAFEAYNRRVYKFKAFYYTAHMYSSDVDDLYKEGYFSASDYNVTDVVNKYRHEIQFSNELQKSPNLLKAQKWFDNMTIYMDALLGLQVRLGNIAVAKLNTKVSELTEIIAVSITFLVIVIILCPFVVMSIDTLTSSIQNYAVTLVERTKRLSSEKKRTESLLYHMVPKTIVEKLKKNVRIDAKYFKSATVLFADIHEFHRLVLYVTPVEVVGLLNSLYNSIDTRLDSFDVYKVETINDCYMVASGVPKRNRDRHAMEIANLALELRDMILTKTFVMSGNKTIKLRFGINTGACMAGVVGLIMPRYCLFGDMINTASRMKSNGLPNKIHLSPTTHVHLAKYGQYVMRKRGFINIKGKGEMETYWLLGKQDDSCLVNDIDGDVPTEGEASGASNTMPGEISQYYHMTASLRVPLPGQVSSRKTVQMKGGKSSARVTPKERCDKPEIQEPPLSEESVVDVNAVSTSKVEDDALHIHDAETEMIEEGADETKGETDDPGQHLSLVAATEPLTPPPDTALAHALGMKQETGYMTRADCQQTADDGDDKDDATGTTEHGPHSTTIEGTANKEHLNK